MTRYNLMRDRLIAKNKFPLDYHEAKAFISIEHSVPLEIAVVWLANMLAEGLIRIEKANGFYRILKS